MSTAGCSDSWLKGRATRRRLFAIGVYCALLLASHLIERLPARSQISRDVRTADVQVIDHGRHLGGRVQLAYRDTAPDSARRPVVLVHGSPGSGEVLDELADLLAPEFRVIVPDLPGFGTSTENIPDYSFRAHADYLIQLLDSLHIDCAQFVGFSMGGGVVLSAFDEAPARVGSLVLLSAIGVQEEELTGNYQVNHFLHGAQLAALWFLRNGVPHFGLFKRFPLTVEYARNFFDSDQRPLRGVLNRYNGPMLIIHGTADMNVPISAAREHHRLVPQSEIVEVNENHFMAFQRPLIFLKPLKKFLRTAPSADCAKLRAPQGPPR